MLMAIMVTWALNVTVIKALSSLLDEIWVELVPVLLGHAQHYLGIDEILGAPQGHKPYLHGNYPV